MDVASTAINATIIAAVGVLLTWFLKGRFDMIDQRFDELGHRIDRVEERLDRLRSDLTQVALAVGVRPPATNR